MLVGKRQRNWKCFVIWKHGILKFFTNYFCPLHPIKKCAYNPFSFMTGNIRTCYFSLYLHKGTLKALRRLHRHKLYVYNQHNWKQLARHSFLGSFSNTWVLLKFQLRLLGKGGLQRSRKKPVQFMKIIKWGIHEEMTIVSTVS